MARRTALASLLILTAFACGRTASRRAPEPGVWYVASPSTSPANALEPGFVFLDSTSLRPVAAGKHSPAQTGVSLFTSFHGTRYHPEALRAVAEDSSVLAAFGVAFGRTIRSGERTLLIDIQDMSPDDLPRMVAFMRTVALAFRATRAGPVAVIVPAGDTVAYPTSVLGRTADLIVVRLADEHRPGTRPGPLVTPEFVRRSLGRRATTLGASRIGALFPLYGYIWNRDGSARPISSRDPNPIVNRESGAFRRDPASSFLTASGRDGWTIWVPDARTIRTLIDATLERGVTFVALAGPDGADPAIIAGDSVKR